MLKTKQELFESHAAMVEKLEKSHLKVVNHETKLIELIEQTKFWIEEYKEQFKEQETFLNTLKVEI
jgi:uncharacterized membrane protein